MDPLLKKMHFKGLGPVLLLNAPKGFKPDFGLAVQTAPKGPAAFILLFVTSQAEAKKGLSAVKKAWSDATQFWMAYPKGTSKLYKNPDINRDSAHTLLQSLGFDGVSLVAIDDDWSAMRFKKLEP